MRHVKVALFLIALCTLMLQLLLIRVFDVILTPSMGYMIISCALFAFGLAGIYASLRPLVPDTDLRRYLAILALLLGASMLLIRPALNFLPFNYELLLAEPAKQLVSFLGMYLVLAVPFFLSGLFFTRVFGEYAAKIQSLYSWDLAGAAVGCVILLPFLPAIGPGGLLFCGAGLSLLAAGVLANGRALRMSSIAAASIAILLPFLHAPEYYDFDVHMSKRGMKEAAAKGQIEFTRWDLISKIDVVDRPRVDQATGAQKLSVKRIAYDGGAQGSNIYPFDGDFEHLRANLPTLMPDHFTEVGVLASHYLKQGSSPRVLAIGAAGGQEVKAALLYGAGKVDAVELVATVVDLGRSSYAEYGGGIYNHPSVHYTAGEGRSYLRASRDQYDIIQIFSNHTSSSIAAGSGAMGPNYLQTAEAYQEYFEHLTETGVLHVNHHLYPKMIATAALAWAQMGRTDFQKHVVVFDQTVPWHTLPTMLIKMQPWTAAEIELLRGLFAMPAEEYRLAEDPLHPAQSRLHAAFFTGDFSWELKRLIPYRVAPATDDRPYFNYYRKGLRPVAPDPERYLDANTAELIGWLFQFRNLVPMDIIHLVVTAMASAVFILLFIYIPLRFSSLRTVAWPRKGSALAYFSCLGAGFIVIELVLIQVFMKLVGFPLYTFATVMFSLLLAAGIGSLCSEKLQIHQGKRWQWPFMSIVVYGLLLIAVHPVLFQAFLSAPTSVRIAAATLMILPLGFFLGMPFPLGILALRDLPAGAVAWAWAMNGLFTLVGGLASVILSVFIGFKLTLLMALGVYGLAAVLFGRMRDSAPALPSRPAQETTETVLVAQP
jgi:spermidine synthase